MSHASSGSDHTSRDHESPDHVVHDHRAQDHRAQDHRAQEHGEPVSPAVDGAPAADGTVAASDAALSDPGVHGLSVDAWNARYRESDRIWSGEPNHALVSEVAELTPGRALDVGCGEGADAIWLAGRGWQVSALDPSEVALQRAQQAAADAGVQISWWLGNLAEADLPQEAFDLVSVMYAVLPLDDDPVRQLASLVAPGGTLLVVHHAEVDRERARAHGFDPDLLLRPDQVAEQLGDGWWVVTHERRERSISGGAGRHHHDDLVVRAIRQR